MSYRRFYHAKSVKAVNHGRLSFSSIAAGRRTSAATFKCGNQRDPLSGCNVGAIDRIYGGRSTFICRRSC